MWTLLSGQKSTYFPAANYIRFVAQISFRFIVDAMKIKTGWREFVYNDIFQKPSQNKEQKS